MEKNKPRFRQLESLLTLILYVEIGLFLAYLITAALGLVVVKIILAVLAILIAVFCEWMLYCAKELLKPRGLWLTCAFFSVIVCTAVSLICNCPDGQRLQADPRPLLPRHHGGAVPILTASTTFPIVNCAI